MSDGRKRRKAKQARRDARRTKARDAEAGDEALLIDEVGQALASGRPMDLLGLVSALIEAATPDPLAHLRAPREDDEVNLDRMVAGFADIRLPETTALLAVLAELLDDEDLRLRCRRELATRHDALPQWLAELADVEVYRAARMTHVLGDSDELLLGSRLAGAVELTACVLVDHNVESEVRDAFFVPNSIDNVISIAAQQNTDPDMSFIDMSLADARAWIEHGIEISFLPPESDSWPASRPLVRWLIRNLPDGGIKYQSPDWDTALLDEFFASGHGAAFDRQTHGDLLAQSLESGDPLRWSVARVEVVLESHYDVSLDVALDLPELLRAFIPFGHAKSGIRGDLTAEALAEIDDLGQAYRDDLMAEDGA